MIVMAAVNIEVDVSNADRRPMCVLCLRPIKAKERLILHNPASRHVIPVLEEFLSELYSVPTAAVLLADSSICRTCMRSIEKYQRLRKDLSNMESEIRPKMDKLGERYGLSRREKGVAIDRPTSVLQKSVLQKSGRQRKRIWYSLWCIKM